MNGPRIRAFATVRTRLSGAPWPLLLEGLIATLAVWAHTRALTSMPRGFYKDETSIAYNAYLIATTGHDEFGVSWPMYIESFGDYKNAGYVYLSVAVMRLLGLRLWTVRLPSVLCWIAGTWWMYRLGRRLWPELDSRLFLLLQLAFTPSLFCLSRVGFEAISLYPALALFLLGIHRGFEGESLRWAAIAGVAIGASTYMYTTFRLLAPLHCLLVLMCYGRREHLRRLLVFAAAAAGTVIPFVWYMYRHGQNLTERYREIGYVHLATPLREKLGMFVERYLDYGSPEYLLLHGDGNMRHHTGYGGMLFVPTLLAALLGIAAVVSVPRLRSLRFHRLLLGGLVLSPVAAALTTSRNHSLQAFSLVLFAIMLAQCGFHHVIRKLHRVAAVVMIAGTAVCAGLYVRDYYGPYKEESIAAFEFYGQRQAIEKALRLGASRVVLDSRRGSRHAELHAPFYRTILGRRLGAELPPFEPGGPFDVKPGEYFILEDKKNALPDLREDLPRGVLYVAAPFERMPEIVRWRRRRQ